MNARVTGMGGHHSAAMLKDEWLTPPDILKALGEFDLDPCAPIDRPWEMAKAHYTVRDNGLLQPWYGRVWLNPPYGLQARAWLNRLAAHGTGTGLIFARTETDMFFDEVWNRAAAVLFLRGRLFFHHVNGERSEHNAGAPSVLVAYGQRDVAALRNSGIAGRLVLLSEADRGNVIG